MMYKITHNSIGTIFFAVSLFFTGAYVANAQALSVTFENEPNPLFEGANVMPGDSVSRTVVVSNNGSNNESVYVDVRNTFSDGLADVMELFIDDGSTDYFDDTFVQFFTDTPVSLGTLSAGGSRTYTFTASLAEAIGNSYQETTMGFDLCVGFEGGDVTCDGGENDEDDGGGGGG